MASADLQRAFASFCRTEGGEKPPGAREDRVHVYRNLVFHNIYSCLSNIFPLSKAALEKEWDELVTRFFSDEDLDMPQLWRMPLFFASYVQNQPLPAPFQELLRFESLDYEVNCMADCPMPLHRREGDVIEDRLVLNPEHRFAAFRYPVFRVPYADLEEAEGAYYLMVYRHPETLRVQVTELSPLYLLVLELLHKESLSGREGLELAAVHFGQLEGVDLFASGRTFLESLLEGRALLGFVA